MGDQADDKVCRLGGVGEARGDGGHHAQGHPGHGGGDYRGKDKVTGDGSKGCV